MKLCYWDGHPPMHEIPKIIPDHSVERKTELGASDYHEYGQMTRESVYDNHKEGQKIAYVYFKKVNEYWFESDIVN